ncbi:MAG: EamA family transporter [Candidatus Marinimicrobia bacterium]|nr:EamA family transporter [Candidatus Neomarinimicrobiota bacterium]
MTGFLWSTGGVMIKMIPWPAIVIAGIRSGICALVIYLYDKPQNYRFGRYTLGGALCYSITVIFFVLANKMTTAGNVIMIQYTAPIYVALFGFSFLGEKSTKIDWLTISIVIIGLGLFFVEELSFTSFWGNATALLAGLGFAGTTLFMRKQKNGRPIDSVLLGNIITFLVCFPLLYQDITFELKPWLYITFLGVVQLGLAYIFYSIAIKYVSALDAIIYLVIEPIFNPLLAFFFLGETMSISAKIGGALVLLGVICRGIYQQTQLLEYKTK